MNAERLLAHYHRIAETPDANARLRGFILDLAVRGKLVPQDTNDEPVSELLKRIKKEKAGLVSAGKIRKFAEPENVEVERQPFDLPAGWRWVRLGDIVTKLTDGTHHSPPNEVSGEFKYITAKNIKDEGVSLAAVTYVSRTVHDEIFSRCNPEKGDILYIKDGATTGVVAINDLDEPFSMLSSVALIKLPNCLFNRLILIFLRSPFFYDQMRGFMKGAAITRVTLKRMAPALVPLPPLAEQRRIVAKVNELMTLCDQLEVARKERETTRDRLTAASLARLNAPDPETFLADALPSLTTRPDQIKQLRQTILNLAVQGKLVPQDSNEEPASQLLTRISRNRKHRRKFEQLDLAELEAPLAIIPRSWVWTVVDLLAADEVNAITDGPFGAQLKTEHYIESAGFRVIRLQNIGSCLFRDEHKSYINQERFDRLSKHHVTAGDLVVAGLVDPQIRCCQIPADIGPALVKADCYRFSVHPQVESRFALYYLNSPAAQEFASIHHHGMTLTRIGLGNFRRIPVPLPPQAEQRRIVAKVAELMALCDRLEASLATGDDARRRLLDALLAEALTPSEQPKMRAFA